MYSLEDYPITYCLEYLKNEKRYRYCVKIKTFQKKNNDETNNLFYTRAKGKTKFLNPLTKI